MEKKVVQLEIGKVFAVIIAIVAVAIIAAMVLQGGYFKGALVTDKQVIVTDDAALKTMEQELARGVVANDVVDHYIKNTGKYFSVDQRNILADEIEAGILAKDKTKAIVADFALDVLTIEAKSIDLLNDSMVIKDTITDDAKSATDFATTDSILTDDAKSATDFATTDSILADDAKSADLLDDSMVIKSTDDAKSVEYVTTDFATTDTLKEAAVITDDAKSVITDTDYATTDTLKEAAVITDDAKSADLLKETVVITEDAKAL